ncbi:LLM class flavin-dependent oxidoreductase [Gordonia humi]|uniref:Alkanesulfonate monooxygenase SsuD/methylene tetrahydromethanopterin reductase-like flavin-dependent oxidoreductase (Luciferase family) n=1 Tax=Gordonia humi TaxID=686429 RepID=A0A840EVI0_9ACTN|nr:LLM class flavin-dependent oxidoreductase [Gordonia humi]MBB4133846.1 alkanesulfonate monooxygenase SsuD/methylene tetrahydromethanopterin reductase-like flavin-dependent oxidoreductase (luciferase family) [Gordonia humi]
MKFGLPWPDGEVAAEAEAAGVAAFCTGDFVDNDSYALLADMVDKTSTAQVGTGIAYAFSRSPYAHASAVRTLHAKAPGRMFVGLGAGAYSINRDWFGVAADRPVARMSDMAGAVRAWLSAENGERVTYDGEFYRIDARVAAPVLGRLDVPILFAGFNKGMVAAAVKSADGVIGHGLFTRRWWDDVVRPAEEKGLAAADKQSTVEHGWLITAVDDDDSERAIADARRMVAFYLTVKTYDQYVEHHGWTDAVDALRVAFKAGDMDGLAAAVTDEMLDQIAICGTTADARTRLDQRRAEGSLARDITYLAPPSFLVSGRRRQAYARSSLQLVTD